MNEVQPSYWNGTQVLFNTSWNGRYHHWVISATETLTSLIGIICSTGLVGNIIIVSSLTQVLCIWVYSKVVKFQDGLESCAFDLTPSNVLWYTLIEDIMTFFFPLPLMFTDVTHGRRIRKARKQESRKIRTMARASSSSTPGSAD
ncbi:LOW QUALITY PROTEIN: melanin-concentrating hormone receptor 2 [Eudromia elegans]